MFGQHVLKYLKSFAGREEQLLPENVVWLLPGLLEPITRKLLHSGGFSLIVKGNSDQVTSPPCLHG